MQGTYFKQNIENKHKTDNFIASPLLFDRAIWDSNEFKLSIVQAI
jgi:hypothetical protein